jgi:hypothetical protein
VFFNGDGKAVARAGIIGPDNKLETFSSFIDIWYDDTAIRIDYRQADGSVKTIDVDSADGILIGLLLPAVHRNGKRVGLLGGSLQTPGATVGFQAVNGD